MPLDFLGIWERGEGQSAAGRALALLGDAAREATLPVGRRDALLLELRERCFGGTFTGVTTCPACSEEIELTFEANEVRRETGDGAPSFALRALGYDVELRLPNSDDLTRLAGARNLSEARLALFESCVVAASRDGKPVEAAGLPEQVVDAASAAMATRDPQADVTLDVTCPSCTHAWLEPFDVVTFLWAEVAAGARRLLREVHELASAYGWSEHEILSLSPARRHAYLEMLG